MPRNDGSDAEAFFVSYWMKKGHIERLRDQKDLVGLNGGQRVADFSKPADFLVSSKIHPLHYAEVKSTVDPKRFGFSKIRPSQSAAALLEAKRGYGMYWFYIFSYAKGAWFTLHCSIYRSLLDEGRRSVLFEELELWEK